MEGRGWETYESTVYPNPDSKASSGYEENICKHLEQCVQPNQSGKAEDSDDDRPNREQYHPSNRGHDAMRLDDALRTIDVL